MKFIKKRLFFIICVAIFLVGVVLFVGGMLIDSDNQEGRDDVKDQYDNANKLAKQAVHQNILTLLKNNAQQASHDEQSVAQLAKNTTTRPILYEKVFPAPPGQSSIIYYRDFAGQYCQSIDDLIKIIRGSDRPSKIEEQKVLDDYAEGAGQTRDIRQPRRTSPEQGVRPGVGVFEMPGMGEMPGMMPGRHLGITRQSQQEEPLIEELRRKRAQQISIYTSPESFCCYDYWKDHQGAGDAEILLADSWFSQIAYWIQQDVVLSIAQVNDNTVSVLENPLKRLIEISFGGAKAGEAITTTRTRITNYRDDSDVASRRVADSRDQLPEYVIKIKGGDNEEMLPSGLIATAWTERISSELVDIVHFEIGVIIDTTRIIEFINVLQGTKTDSENGAPRNQITVLEIQTEPVEIQLEKAAGFHYGSGSLTVLRLTCEYAFFKSGYEKLKPKPVQQLFLAQSDFDSTDRSSKKFSGRSAKIS